jgi:mannose-6-phosphate isomerase-like protein (cupin superfamily)
MINVKHKLEIKDRWVFNLTPITSEEQEFLPIGTDYVLMKHGNFNQNNIAFKDTNGAFCVNSPYKVSGEGMVISFPGLRLLESRYYVQNELDIGNLTYIDGGTNTTAIGPSRLGDPVVNYVHFPANMYQTLHTHPSHRIGVIIKGRGKVELDNELYEVIEGETFFMRRNELHNFITEDSEVILYVFAPDSGTGPTDEINPLKIRTYIGQQRSDSKKYLKEDSAKRMASRSGIDISQQRSFK